MSAKTAAQRKRDERERLRTQGITVLSFKVSSAQKDKLTRLCNETVRPGDDPFTFDELLTRIIEKEYKLFENKLAELSKYKCSKCQDPLPANCNKLFYGDAGCYLTRKCKILYP